MGTLLIHVGIEVALDRCLLLAEPDLAAALYGALEPVEPDALGRALADLCGPQAAALAETFQLFRARRHLEEWSHRERAAASLERVCRAVLAGRRARGALPDRALPDSTGFVRFLAAAEAALEGSPYPPTAIGTWLGAGEGAGAAEG